ncbi:MAG: signal recognition particle protein [Phycisphaeraceae bacterium]|nr:MAG: signal recognition particle protein [Phycisphaeraceae bacterium]
MFDRLTDAFQGVYKRLSGQSSLTERNVREAMGEVRTALIDADAHHEVVDAFCEAVVRSALGREVTRTLKPGEEMIGVVHEELIKFLGGEPGSAGDGGMVGGALGVPGAVGAPAGPGVSIMRVSPGPTVVMMCGLQGSGKTTTCGKLAAYLKKRGRSVMLAAADLQRPAAVEQLQTVASQVRDGMPGNARVEFYGEPGSVAEYGKAVGAAVKVCGRALEAARREGIDVLIVDTAGRLHVNEALMGELRAVADVLRPHHSFLVVDAMSGQDAVNSARAFHQRLAVDGVILTKFDSDTRGGAALSVKHVTGAPIAFVGVGEKLDALEEFHADRYAGRILGMGDVLSLVERAHEQVSAEDAEKLQAKMARGEMSMDDFLGQLRALRRMGSMRQLLGMLPGVGRMLKDVHVDDKQLDRVEAMINSMSKKERADPGLIDFSRKKRIAAGSGVKVDEVGQLVKRFEAVKVMSSSMASMSAADRVKAVKQMQASGGMDAMVPGLQGMPGLGRPKGSSYTASIKDRFKKRRK